MSESTANAIKYIIMAPPKKLYSFNLKDDALNELKLITKLYFNEKLESCWNQYVVKELWKHSSYLFKYKFSKKSVRKFTKTNEIIEKQWYNVTARYKLKEKEEYYGRISGHTSSNI